ncbi:DUF3888 domain-containing protein [Bacillus amyloliquefaciens]|uniref:DUF3888 domain-containing protein n=1 Tax=Bacillus amyloliquefaciens TaxID=1390 RepID=UPI000693C8E4|nr:DUF3888 domain-containing protein [Bacillus amyloliquefaciens]
MRKNLFIICFCMMFSFLFSDSTAAQNYNKRDMYDSYMTLLNPYARKVIKEEYGLYDAKIVSIKRVSRGRTEGEKRINDGSFDFIVKVQYRTFTGPHTPPETIETVTFRVIPSGVKVVKHTSKKLQ